MPHPMGASLFNRCHRKQPFGWYCTRGRHNDGWCYHLPHWWNFGEIFDLPRGG